MKSMTGFGRAKLEKNNRSYCVEIKSVNHKYNDISIKLPKSLSYLEEKIKKEILKCVSRGKIDVNVSFENYSDEGKQIVINRELVKRYIEEFNKLAEENNTLQKEINIADIIKLPDVVALKNVDDEEIIEKELLEAVEQAISNFMQMKVNEGNKIQEDLQVRIEKINDEVEKITQYSTRLIEEYVVKLNERIKKILKTDIIDEQRLAMETVIYADKCSIQEEITRLKSHIYQFKELIKEENSVGKKVDFLLQEMNREINTVGSKSGSLDITDIVINIKTELEDIREQIQNIE